MSETSPTEGAGASSTNAPTDRINSGGAEDVVVHALHSPEPNNVVLESETCLGNLRAAAKLATSNVLDLRDAVTADFTAIHTRMHALTRLSADRFDQIEVRLTAIEGKSRDIASHLALAPAPVPVTPQIVLSDTPRPRIEIPTPSRENNQAQDDEFTTPVATQPKTSRGIFLNVLGTKLMCNVAQFSGASGENFSTFVRSFEDHANAAKTPLTPDDKRAVFLTYLTDFARDKAQELIDTKGAATFEEVVAHLKTTFQDPTRSEMERQQLRRCAQRSEESVDAFCTRVRKLAQSAYVDKTRDFIQDKAKEAFIDGLLFNLKFHVKGESPQTFQDALNSAIKFELLLSEAAKANTILPQGLAVAPAIPPTPATTPRPQHASRPFQKRSFTCYECGLEGHFAADCRRRQNPPRQQPQRRFNYYRNQRPQFPRNDPVDHHQLPRQQGENRYVQAIAPVEPSLVEQLRDQLRVSQNQVSALIKRNSELASANMPPPSNNRGNVLSYCVPTRTFLTLFTLFFLFTHSSALSPLVCMPHSPVSYLRLPSPVDCAASKHLSASDPVTTRHLTIYRDNTLIYEAEGTLCKIVKQTTRYSVNIFGVRVEESTSKQLMVSVEECVRMRDFQNCEHGELQNHSGFSRTNNAHVVDWPSPPFSIFLGTQVLETKNCFVMPTRITARYGSETPSSAAGSMTGCRYSTGSCNTREGAAFIWKPQASQSCRFVYFNTMKGHQSGRFWLSEDRQMALSYDSNSTRVADCGKKILITDQGYGVELPIRAKRQVEPSLALHNMTNFVTSNQLASQLLALEEAVLTKTGNWFWQNFMSFCSSTNSLLAATLSMIASNPTLAARKLTQRNNIHAKYLGDGYISIQSCSSIPPSSFSFVPFTEKCYSNPSVQILLPTNISITTFIDLATGVITNRAHPVDCPLVSNFEYIVNGSLVSLNPFTLVSTTNPDFHPILLGDKAPLTSSALEEDPLIFRNLIIGSMSENIPDSHYNEVWEALQGSPEAITRIISAHSSPTSGPLAPTDLEEIVGFWSRFKKIWSVVFYVWTLLTDLVLTLVIAAVAIVGVAGFYASPWLSFITKRSQNRSSDPLNSISVVTTPTKIEIVGPNSSETTPRVTTGIPDCAKEMKRLKSPRVNVLSFEGPKFFTAQIPIRVNGISCWALIDTGAGFTVASQEICALIGVARLNPSSVDHALGLGGNEVEMAGSATVRFEIGSNTIFQTTHFTVGQCTPEGTQGYEFILGNDILQRLPKFHLNYAEGCLEIGDEKLPLGTRPDTSIFPSRYAIHISRDTVIPPRSELFVKCVAPLCGRPSDLVLVSQANTLTKQELLVAPAVFASENPILLITNPTNEPKTLYANSTAATATTLNEERETPSVLYYA